MPPTSSSKDQKGKALGYLALGTTKDHSGQRLPQPAAGCGTAASLQGKSVSPLALKCLPSESSSVSKRQVSFHLDSGLEDGPGAASQKLPQRASAAALAGPSAALGCLQPALHMADMPHTCQRHT